jgi:hypothetical protein
MLIGGTDGVDNLRIGHKINGATSVAPGYQELFPEPGHETRDHLQRDRLRHMHTHLLLHNDASTVTMNFIQLLRVDPSMYSLLHRVLWDVIKSVYR